MTSAGRFIARSLLTLAIVGACGWASMASLFGPWRSTPWATTIACAGLVAALSTAFARLERWTLPLVIVALAAFLIRWSSVVPSNQRAWQLDVAVLPHATFEGDLVTVHNIREFEYRTETDYTPHYYDKTFDLRQLDSADLIASYWMGDVIAHVIASFGFADKDFLAVSIETRKEIGESYSTIDGFFRNYELTYVVGDERDLIGLRANVRNDPREDVYLYRTNAPPDNVRRLFLDYFREIDALVDHPKFYNTLTTNCATTVLMHTRVNPGRHGYSWKVLLSGYAPLYLYELGRLDARLPFEELKRRSRINDAARAAGPADDFSVQIRRGLPRPVEEGS